MSSLWDGVNKAIGKATQSVSEVAQGISDASREVGETISAASQKSKAEHQAKEELKAEKKAGELRKCPNCGQPLDGITAVCPMCGYVLHEVKGSDSIKDLSKEINKLEKNRRAVVESLKSKISGRANTATDEKIASLIRNFIVPNTKEDIFEFMLLASGNMDAKVLAGKKKDEDVSELVVKAWEAKFQQTYQKAKISFGSDVDFKKIQDIYDTKLKEIEDAKRWSLFRR